MAYLGILSGIDSYDSNGWIQKAAFGVIQLPGISDRFLKKKSHNRPYLIKDRKQRNCKEPINEIDIFMNCKCDACMPFYKENWTDKDWKIKQDAFSGRGEGPRKLRSIHNVSLYQNEINEIRKVIEKRKLLEFIKNRLKFSIYYKFIDFIQTLKQKELEELKDFNKFLE
jgi:tRNA-guanine family transglycosylase